MRFNWDSIIPSVALMHDDPAIPPISGTGFSIERGDSIGDFTIHIHILDQPAEQVTAEPPNPPTA